MPGLLGMLERECWGLCDFALSPLSCPAHTGYMQIGEDQCPLLGFMETDRSRKRCGKKMDFNPESQWPTVFHLSSVYFKEKLGNGPVIQSATWSVCHLSKQSPVSAWVLSQRRYSLGLFSSALIVRLCRTSTHQKVLARQLLFWIILVYKPHSFQVNKNEILERESFRK